MMFSKRFSLRWCAPVLAVLALSQTTLHAHHLPPGFEGVDEFEHSRAMLVGLQHPLSGWDHCLALVAIGTVAAMMTRKNLFLPALMLGGLVVGGALGLGGGVMPQIPFLAAAVLLAAGGVMTLQSKAMSLLMATTTAAFGLWQGATHALMVNSHAALGSYAAGFLMGSAALMFAGALVAVLARRLPARVQRLAGASMAVAGLLSAVISSF
jgi:urease accessory protein